MMGKKPKEPYFAFLLSLLVPGLGQIYAGKVIKGLFLFLIIASLNLGAAAHVLKPATKVSLYCAIPSALSFICILYCLFDAYLSAKRYNVSHKLERLITLARRGVFIVAIVSVPLIYYLVVPQIVSFVEARVCRLYAAPPNSMEPTIYKGERLLVDLTAYKKSGPRRGDVVVYRYPKEPAKLYLHRIVGLPGESVVLKDHRIVIDGAQLTEGWAVKIRHYNGGKLAKRGMKPIVIPQNSYFVLGDDASRSQDSRFWGCLPQEYILGKGYKICYPFNRSGPIE